MKRFWILIGVILLVGGILFEEKHRAETFKHHHPSVVLRDPWVSTPGLVRGNHFVDNVNLWSNSPVKAEDADLAYASLTFQSDLKPASTEKFQSKIDYRTEPVLTVLDRQIAYAFFAAGGFTLTLNLKPAYPNPDAIMPSRIDPGIRASFSF